MNKNSYKLIDKAAVVAEINQRIEDYKSHKIDDSYHDGLIFALEDLRDDFINTLEVKEVDLEKEIDFAMPSKYCWSGDGKAVYTKEQMRNFAKYFFELGLRLQTETNITFKYNIGDSVREYKSQKGE